MGEFVVGFVLLVFCSFGVDAQFRHRIRLTNSPFVFNNLELFSGDAHFGWGDAVITLLNLVGGEHICLFSFPFATHVADFYGEEAEGDPGVED